MSDKTSNKLTGGMHLKVICTVCEKNAKFNTTLGIYYCPSHGYETKLNDLGEHMGELVENLEQMKVLV
jgi:hypothetical protein